MATAKARPKKKLTEVVPEKVTVIGDSAVPETEEDKDAVIDRQHNQIVDLQNRVQELYDENDELTRKLDVYQQELGKLRMAVVNDFTARNT